MAHPSAAAAEREAREQAAAQPAALPPAAAPAPVKAAPAQPEPAAPPPPAPEPAAPAQTAPAQPAGPTPAQQRKALAQEQAQARKARQDAARQAHAEEKAARHAKVKEQPQASAPAREPVFAPETAAAAPATSAATAAAVETAPLDAPVEKAIIMFSNTRSAHCAACDTVKISVTPSGKVLIERGRWTGANRDWRYRKSVTHVSPARAAAFAARVNGYRPAGDKALGSCPASSSDGLVIEWIAAERQDRLTVTFACSDAQAAQALRSAPDLLGLRQLDFAWGQR